MGSLIVCLSQELTIKGIKRQPSLTTKGPFFLIMPHVVISAKLREYILCCSGRWHGLGLPDHLGEKALLGEKQLTQVAV